MAAPVVAARLHQDFPIATAVLIAGGSDVASILLETTLEPEDLRLRRRRGRLDQSEEDAFTSSYHRTVRLDSRRDRRMARATSGPASRGRLRLRDSPVLTITARSETPPTGTLVVSGGPLRALRRSFPGKATRSCDWIQRSLRPRSAIIGRLRPLGPPCPSSERFGVEHCEIPARVVGCSNRFGDHDGVSPCSFRITTRATDRRCFESPRSLRRNFLMLQVLGTAILISLHSPSPATGVRCQRSPTIVGEEESKWKDRLPDQDRAAAEAGIGFEAPAFPEGLDLDRRPRGSPRWRSSEARWSSCRPGRAGPRSAGASRKTRSKPEGSRQTRGR